MGEGEKRKGEKKERKKETWISLKPGFVEYSSMYKNIA
jgi:hypothetical protein